jgi:hypothetical protein
MKVLYKCVKIKEKKILKLEECQILQFVKNEMIVEVYSEKKSLRDILK